MLGLVGVVAVGVGVAVKVRGVVAGGAVWAGATLIGVGTEAGAEAKREDAPSIPPITRTNTPPVNAMALVFVNVYHSFNIIIPSFW